MNFSSVILWDRMKRHWQLYILLILPVLYMLIFEYVPMLGVGYAFVRYSPRVGIFESRFVGFQNILKFINSYQFKRVVPNTLILSVYSLVAAFPIAILFALMLNSMRSERMKRIIQNVTYIPHFISTVVLVGMMMQLFSTRNGIMALLYSAVMGKPAPDIFGSARSFAHVYVWSGIWQNTGWNAIIYVAALSGIDPQLHEAAVIDGASRFKRVLHVDIPGIIPTVVTMLILRFGFIMSVGFEKVFLMQNNLNLSASEVISTYVYQVGLSASGGDLSYATAIDLFNSVINFGLLLMVNGISKRISEVGLW